MTNFEKVKKAFKSDADKDIRQTEININEEFSTYSDEELNNLRQNRRLRKEYANKIFIMICIWLIIILAIVVLQGVRLLNISNSVLIALITTTTANVAAYFLVVTNYLFQTK